MSSNITIIAEAGVNHNGDLSLAKKMVETAARAGADYIKFQTFRTEKLVSRTAPKADYQRSNDSGKSDDQFTMLKKLEIPTSWYPELLSECERHHIEFLSTAFDIESIDFLETLNPPFFKIPSGELTNLFYLRHIAGKGRPVILSTGMGNMAEIRDALSLLMQGGLSKNQITLLHCNTDYPTPPKEVNLGAMRTMADETGLKTGYSDHTAGIEIAIAAAALGATVIEKHFTLSRKLPGPDHLASLEPDELTQMIKGIRNVELALSGSGEKKPAPSEKANIKAARKSLHLARDVEKGTILTEEMLMALRPGDGISPMQLSDMTGRSVNRDLKLGEKLNLEDLT